jgi:hypothetical protein
VGYRWRPCARWQEAAGIHRPGLLVCLRSASLVTKDKIKVPKLIGLSWGSRLVFASVLVFSSLSLSQFFFLNKNNYKGFEVPFFHNISALKFQ